MKRTIKRSVRVLSKKENNFSVALFMVLLVTAVILSLLITLAVMCYSVEVKTSSDKGKIVVYIPEEIGVQQGKIIVEIDD